MTSENVQRAVMRCPYCRRPILPDELRQASGEPVQPTDGDTFLCWACKKYAAFTDDGARLRRATDDEIHAIELERFRAWAGLPAADADTTTGGAA